MSIIRGTLIVDLTLPLSSTGLLSLGDKVATFARKIDMVQFAYKVAMTWWLADAVLFFYFVWRAIQFNVDFANNYCVRPVLRDPRLVCTQVGLIFFASNFVVDPSGVKYHIPVSLSHHRIFDWNCQGGDRLFNDNASWRLKVNFHFGSGCDYFFLLMLLFVWLIKGRWSRNLPNEVLHIDLFVAIYSTVY